MAKKGRILCLQQDSIFETYGGAQYYIDDLLTSASHLLGWGQVKSIVPQRRSELKREDRQYSIELVPMKARGILRKLQNRYSLSFFTTAYKTIKRFQPSYLLAAHVSLAPMAWFLSKLTGIPYYVVALGYEVWGDLLPQDEFALKHSAGIISISEWTKQVLCKRGYSSNKIFIVHPSFNEHFDKLPIEVKKLEENTPLKLLSISRLSASERYKGQDHVLQALAVLRKQYPEYQIEYTIQGDGDDKPRLETLVRELKLEPWVKFKERVTDRNELSELYKNTDVFIMPSRFGKWDGEWKGEGFGIVYVEAALFGVPSIAYNCGGATDIIESEKSGILINQNDIQGLAHSILRYYKDRTLINKMGTTAQSISKQKFGPKAMAKSLESFFEQTSF